MPTATLPRLFYTAAQVRELDRQAIEDEGIPGDQLMERAGRAAWRCLQRHWPQAARLAVFCGGGNNGGDGYVIARLAAEAGLMVTIYQQAPMEKLKGSALTMAQRAGDTRGVTVVALDGPPQSLDADVIVDALLGTGLGGEVRADYAAIIDAINASDCPVFSVDIASGVCADSGRVLGVAVRADMTVTFIGLKSGLLTASGPGQCGELAFDDLRVPAGIYERVGPAGERLVPDDIRRALPPRSRDAHKGHFGHVLVVGGDHGFSGAAAMAAQAAGRAGAGLVSVATRVEHVPVLVTRQPDSLLDKSSVVVLGPGLGQNDWGRALMDRVLASGLPRVLDADALNLLAAQDSPAAFRHQVLTPHPGEAARMLDTDTAGIQSARFEAVQKLQQCYGGAAVLKGAGSLVCGGPDEPLGLCTAGNPGMASGGMGDVLSGVLGGLLAQGLDVSTAARVGTLVHALAADRSAEAEGQRGLLATDLLPEIRAQVNGGADAD